MAKYNLFVNGNKRLSADCPELFVEAVFLYREMLRYSHETVTDVKHIENDLLFTVRPKRRLYLKTRHRGTAKGGLLLC